MRLFFVMILLLGCSVCHADSRLTLLNDNCVRCHLTCERNGKPNSVLLWKKSVHYTSNSGCADCHGGNRYLDLKFNKGHIGLPDKRESEQMCGQCHQYEYEQMAKRNLKGILNGSKCSVSCIDCHGHHNIEPSTVHCINAGNCSRCHSPDHANDLIGTIRLADSKLKSLKKQIQKRIRKRYPAASSIADLEKLNYEFKAVFHEITMKELSKVIRSQTLVSATKLQTAIDDTKPTNWYVQGACVILFLSLCFVLTLYLSKVL